MPAEFALTPGTAIAAPDAAPTPWPAGAIEQISALKRLATVSAVSVDDAMRHCHGARRDMVVRHRDRLANLGEVREGQLHCGGVVLTRQGVPHKTQPDASRIDRNTDSLDVFA